MNIEAARCPACGAAFSEASVLAMAPVCTHCGVVSVVYGGTLGTLGAFGVADSELTRRRIQADLDILQDYDRKLVGLIEANKQQLMWPSERYASRPDRPQLREAGVHHVDFPPLGTSADVWCLGYLLPLLTVWTAFGWSVRWPPYDAYFIGGLFPVLNWVPLVPFALFFGWRPLLGSFAFWLVTYFVLYRWLGRRWLHRKTFGEALRYNAAQEQQHSLAVASALEAAVALKAAQDHRLGIQIRDAEGRLKTIRRQIAAVQAHLSSA